MKKSTYRAIVWASMLIPLMGWALESHFSLLPVSLKSVYDSMVRWGGIRRHSPLVWLSMAAVMALTLASFYGQLRFRSWAPRLAVYAALLGVLVACFAGPVLQSGLNGAASYAGCLLQGGALALPYFSVDVRAMFWPETAGKSAGGDGVMGQEIGSS